jgi:integrase
MAKQSKGKGRGKSRDKLPEPPFGRSKIPQPRGKPLLVVNDSSHRPIQSDDPSDALGWDAGTERYYRIRSDPREYLGRDLQKAITRFREFAAGASDKTAWGRMNRPQNPRHKIAGWAEPINADAGVLNPIIAVEYDFTDPELLAQVRAWILRDPRESARRLNIPELARLSSLPDPGPSAPISSLYDAYKSKRKRPTEKELVATKRYWDYFIENVAPAKLVRDVSPERVKTWADAAYAPYHDGGSAKMVRHRIEYVRRILRYAATQGIDRFECERVLSEIRKVELPNCSAPDPRPISREDFEALLEVADERWKAMLLTALNLCYYGCDLRTLPRSAIRDNGTVIFERAKTKTARVGVLWQRTRDALAAYEEAEPHESDFVFISDAGAPYSDQGLRHGFQRLRVRADVKAELAHIRDGAYTAAIEGGADVLHAQILAGHKTGVKDNYIRRNPKMVADACQAIERHYFPEPRTEEAPKR